MNNFCMIDDCSWQYLLHRCTEVEVEINIIIISTASYNENRNPKKEHLYCIWSACIIWNALNECIIGRNRVRKPNPTFSPRF